MQLIGLGFLGRSYHWGRGMAIRYCRMLLLRKWKRHRVARLSHFKGVKIHLPVCQWFPRKLLLLLVNISNGFLASCISRGSDRSAGKNNTYHKQVWILFSSVCNFPGMRWIRISPGKSLKLDGIFKSNAVSSVLCIWQRINVTLRWQVQSRFRPFELNILPYWLRFYSQIGWPLHYWPGCIFWQRISHLSTMTSASREGWMPDWLIRGLLQVTIWIIV